MDLGVNLWFKAGKTPKKPSLEPVSVLPFEQLPEELFASLVFCNFFFFSLLHPGFFLVLIRDSDPGAAGAGAVGKSEI